MDNNYIINNLIVLLYDAIVDEKGYSGMDDPDFRAYVCEEVGMDEDLFDEITGFNS